MLNLDGGNKTQKRVLSAIAVVLVTGVFGYFTYRDFRKISEIEAEITSAEASIQLARNKISKIPELEKDVIVRRENLNEYVKILPDDRQINDFVNMINSFADRSEVEVSKLDDVGARSRKAVKKGAADPFEKLVYKIELKGSTESILDFTNSFESFERFVKVSSVEVRTGRDASDARKSHEANIELETYVYNAGGGAIKPVAIQGFDEKRESLAEAILASRDDIEIEHYDFEITPRRDPFSNPRVFSGQSIEEDLVPIEEQQKTLLTLSEEVDEILNQIELEGSDVSTFGVVERAELKRQINEKLVILQETVSGLLAREYFSGAIKGRFSSEVVDPVGRLLSERNIVGGSALTLDELGRVRNTMRDLFSRGQYGDVISTYGRVESRFHFVTGTDAGVELIKEVDQLKGEASAILEFSERNVAVTGVIVRPNNGSVAVVNGKVLGVGDTLDGDILVTSIDVDKVEFSFKSVSIRRTVE